MSAADTLMVLTTEIRSLARTMVRLDEWMETARRNEEWGHVGELEELRLETQFRRSDMMYDAWCARKDPWG